MFFNELEVLEVRLNELSDVVDKFVLVEATRTHSNKEKPLHFDRNKSRFEKFLEKITHIVVEDYPPYENSWTYEKYQRDQIVRALVDCGPEDIIIISDADEIPRSKSLMKSLEMPGVKILEQDLFYYFFNMINIKERKWRRGSRVLRFGDMRQSPTAIRLGPGKVIPDGGWHFSYIGGADRIITKIESFAHQEFNTDSIKDKESLIQKIENGQDLYGRKKSRFRPLALDDTFPVYLLENQDKFADFIKEPLRETLWTRLSRFMP